MAPTVAKPEILGFYSNVAILIKKLDMSLINFAMMVSRQFRQNGAESYNKGKNGKKEYYG